MTALVRFSPTCDKRVDHVVFIIKILRALLLIFNHFEELGEVDGPAHVLVDLGDHLEELLLGRLLAHGLEDLPQLPDVDRAASVLVEGEEGVAAACVVCV